MKSCWIFCGAPLNEFNVYPPKNAYIIAADSGYTAIKKLGIKPDLLIGDFDSLCEKITDECQIITAPAEKDDTDTMLAVKTALNMGFDDITLALSIGGRLDHTYANIQTLAYIVDNNANGCMIGENDIVYLLNKGKYVFDNKKNMYFSIFSFSNNAIISITGTKYILSEYTLTNKFPLGVSNEIINENCILSVNSGQILVIFSSK